MKQLYKGVNPALGIIRKGTDKKTVHIIMPLYQIILQDQIEIKCTTLVR